MSFEEINQRAYEQEAIPDALGSVTVKKLPERKKGIYHEFDEP